MAGELTYSGQYYRKPPQDDVEFQHLWKVMDDIQAAMRNGALNLDAAISSLSNCCNYIATTYSDLVALIGSGNLLPLHYYIITDFVSTFKLTNVVDGVGSVEQLVVYALSASTISSQAISLSYPQDIIHYSVTDTTPLAPNLIANSKGVIVYRKSTDTNLSAYYDWRNVLFRRWERTAGGGLFFWNTDPSPYVGSGGQAHLDLYTFYNASGGSNTNCSIGEGSYNIVMGDSNSSIIIENNCGALGGGINIGSFNNGINIRSNCATQASASSFMPPGIYIGDSNIYIEIGQRSYSVYLENSCYAINLGTQQSDVAIPSNTWRKVMFKGFSNFEATIDITGLDYIDLVNNEIQILGGLIKTSIGYCGIIYLSSSNPSETINQIIPITSSVVFSPYRFIPDSGLACIFQDKSVSGGSANMILPNLSINIDNANSEYIILDRYMLTLGTVTTDFHLEYTNSISILGGYVQSVTGLDTDNTDPQNPVVQIAVDGVTITGDGTPGNPLVGTPASGDSLSPLLLMGA